MPPTTRCRTRAAERSRLIVFGLWLVLHHMFGRLTLNPLTRNNPLMDCGQVNRGMPHRHLFPGELPVHTGRNAQLVIQAARLGRIHRHFQPYFQNMRQYFMLDQFVQNYEFYGEHFLLLESHVRNYTIFPYSRHTGVGRLLTESRRFAPHPNDPDIESFTYPDDYQLTPSDILEYRVHMPLFNMHMNHRMPMVRNNHIMLLSCNTSMTRFPTGPGNALEDHRPAYTEGLRASNSRQMDMVLIFIWMRQTSYGIVSHGGNRLINVHWINRFLLNFIYHNPGFLRGVEVRIQGQSHDLMIIHPRHYNEQLRRLIMEALAELRLLFD